MSSKLLKGNVVRDSDAYALSPRHEFISDFEEPDPASEEPEISSPEVLLQAARQEADRLIQQAGEKAQTLEEKARTLLEDARAEAEELKELTRQEGYRQGYEEGMTAAQDEGEKLQTRIRQVLAEAEECRRETLRKLEAEIVALSREIAEKLVATQLTIEPKTVLKIAEDALQLLYDREQVTLFAHPKEAEIFKGDREELLKLLPEKAALRVIADPTVEPGGCRVETERGLVDSSLDKRWEALLKALYAEG